jgi:hypothetical protein
MMLNTNAIIKPAPEGLHNYNVVSVEIPLDRQSEIIEAVANTADAMRARRVLLYDDTKKNLAAAAGMVLFAGFEHKDRSDSLVLFIEIFDLPSGYSAWERFQNHGYRVTLDDIDFVIAKASVGLVIQGVMFKTGFDNESHEAKLEQARLWWMCAEERIGTARKALNDAVKNERETWVHYKELRDRGKE